eukprot:scaffold188024_cov20-Tisochrysis_lutea.AAC.1
MLDWQDDRSDRHSLSPGKAGCQRKRKKCTASIEPGALRGGVHLSAHLIPAQRTCDRPAQAAVPRLPELVLPAAPGQGHHPGPWAHSSTGRRATHAQSRTGARKGMLLGILWLGG